MKLRRVISQYSVWIAAVVAANERGLIDPVDADEKLQQLMTEMRKWLGEPVLNLEVPGVKDERI